MKPGPTCSQCGTNLRGGTTCPRGPQCARDQADHDELMRRITAIDAEKRGAK